MDNKSLDKKYKKTLLNVYNQDYLKGYGKKQSEWKKSQSEYFGGFLKTYNKTSILDLGCGRGNESLFFQEQGYDVTSIDLSEEAVNICISRGLKAIQMDFYSLSFPDSSFDAIFAQSSIVHVPKNNLDIVLNEVYRCLKQDGLFFLGLYKGYFEGELFRNKDRYFSMYQMDEIQTHLESKFIILDENHFRPTRLERYVSLILKKK
ncbi:class I SAM-dependent methyltransferase (plasmid) [Bacillus cereus]|uniref:Class I SAM-dependent methyltransferase n=1 Tax=Bacillus cereus TaxID=1396 RepID=A0AB73USY9_BACCE|nr:class I SAM-dependent methyltransferase [Bacillus cereus]HDR3523474.1 class I SAM-dependent methyltransferase [Bacillus pacificus]QHV47427.2 class I SAM-dependent methyltransferase [Bacillus cereus]QHV47584.2 class I SAM-dependent methyltransferase [Bacillus cereus]HDR3634031.1 class I SAM-dependent methyltransferase [Bacillus pacificus]HDR7652967.1 class I SAM-dependent methyltransferase [Bacillus pacificus]